jgi:hypothetical protein
MADKLAMILIVSVVSHRIPETKMFEHSLTRLISVLKSSPQKKSRSVLFK